MQRFTVTLEKENGNTSIVAIEPLEQGYGHTLGNSLRRCLLSSIPGSAITSVKINGVSHQFSTLKGVVEDAIQIILNLKKVRVRIYGDKAVRLTINKSGAGEVKASDIDTQGVAEIVTPDVHIATLTDSKVKFVVELTAETGVGYVPSEEKKINEIGTLAVDALYSPVISVNYTVDQTRVGRNTNFDKLLLEITTDGTIAPLDAVNKAAEVLTGYFKQVYEPMAAEETEVVKPSSTISEDLLKSSVEELDLPVRITNALKAIEIDTIGKLVSVPKIQLMKAKNLGTKSLGLISEKLTERGLSLGEA
ncbi:DNA-directed RNA polymerase subunit alpha [Candidatus Daviesbacteria bacterium RIFCSPHIGHO2_01_FULL_44_29]|uniref:DNA-directed RNA polymerase subunit alpha n=1 Tax=Candidatus Daviesbacteria bacterium RIFCSPHIGHO2_02_FULL_43_12 TaxID=1797776 RepID=A0A1F5KG55_9BACT|nr:MAG: DNA-directed RNA polymerase subunit alpha [Candidatus Daviesbacteria bacterium RIFCSPHIGHO2_01_FULL_44_29]OGE39933.1 MAG: DNA-directed RNA polymerase subunit alpha [Candidatus Daviesbacteria bacterium RIFCSPHIGHO2_02_FULL_43_12]OGE40509.1 MAG: DNA-directed RNA polymerase subunit alpha [Candidatus Daviesbacteria bacterium RIFCSPHIGHO2_12_FULL_47_45]OGE70386.1 MAG: DNA-directed RNA polymerase subunit alpha [Candidatus Daviesbacteria bacterium RIFCSPLOWO2_01_FULL_43_15]